MAAESSLFKQSKDTAQWVVHYTTAVIVVGSIVVMVALTQLPADRFGLLLFVLMAVITELTSVELFSASRIRISLSSIIAIASIVVLGPMAGVLTQLASGVITIVTTSLLQRHMPAGGRAPLLRRAAFNSGMFVIGSGVAGLIYVMAGGTSGTLLTVTHLLPLSLAVTADLLTNIVLLIGVISLQTGRTPQRIWNEDIRWGVPINVLGGIFGGGFLAQAYGMFNLVGLVVFFLPVLLTGYSYRVYIDNMKEYVDKLKAANDSLDAVNLELLETLGAVIDADDAYTSGHSAQVAIYAGALAQQLNLSPQLQSTIVKAALVHDVGKVGIMDSIINKPGPLTDEEYTLMKRHTVIGAEIVSRMKGLQELVPLIRHHHERWDGRGYPDGLAEAEIPLGARIIAMADSLDAMCSDRPYRATRSLPEVKKEVVECLGSQFDPDIVRAFLALAEEQGPEYFRNSAAAVDKAIRAQGIGTVLAQKPYAKKSMLVSIH